MSVYICIYIYAVSQMVSQKLCQKIVCSLHTLHPKSPMCSSCWILFIFTIYGAFLSHRATPSHHLF